MIAPEVRRVLDAASIAHLATVLDDGSPHTTPVFVGTEGNHIAVFTPARARLRRATCGATPRVALSIAPADNPFEPS